MSAGSRAALHFTPFLLSIERIVAPIAAHRYMFLKQPWRLRRDPWTCELSLFAGACAAGVARHGVSQRREAMMQLSSKSFVPGQAIPAANALGVPGPDGPVPGPNKSPHLAWLGVPAGARSFVVTCVDSEAPTKADDVNKKDRTVPYDLPRADFVHWLLVDIPVSVSELSEGLDSSGLTAKGKAPGRTPHGVRGLNDYTGWFASDPDMAGNYAGYDGPWPPFNDERRHRYTLRLYALDIESLGLSGAFTLADAKRAMEGHVVAQASIESTYAIYPDAR